MIEIFGISGMDLLFYTEMTNVFMTFLLIVILLRKGAISIKDIKQGLDYSTPILLSILRYLNDQGVLQKGDITKLLALSIAIKQRPDLAEKLMQSYLKK